MTFWWSEDNYGQLLQCYALQKYLQNAGHDAYLIRYTSSDYVKLSYWEKMLKIFSPVKLYNFIRNKKRRILGLQESRANPRHFETFRRNHIKQSEKTYYSHKELVEDPPLADIYIVGSDQIWNILDLPVRRAINVINAYLLNFGDPSIKRISYAASFGKECEELDDDFINVFSFLLKKFHYISVREGSGLEICKRCGIDNAEWVPDPTMLLDTSIYRALYKGETIGKPNKPYCFLYLLGNQFNISVHEVYKWAKEKKIEIVYVTGNWRQDKFQKTYATIPEWIYLLEHSEYVITNSYHCAVFSLLFEKKFGIVPLTRNAIGMNSRFDSMFQLFGIEDRYVSTNLSVLDIDIDYRFVANTFQNIRDTCRLNEIVSEEMKCP